MIGLLQLSYNDLDSGPVSYAQSPATESPLSLANVLPQCHWGDLELSRMLETRADPFPLEAHLQTVQAALTLPQK